MQRNTELFNDIAEALLVHPDRYRWDQEQWGFGPPEKRNAHTCGTRHCTAGFAVAFSGYMPFDPVEWDWEEVTLANSDRSKYEDVSDVARSLLGLYDEESDLLFDGLWKPFAAEWRSWKENGMPTRLGFKRKAAFGTPEAQAIALILIGRGAEVATVGTNRSWDEVTDVGHVNKV